MTVLSRFARAGQDDLVSLECDVCVPPVLSSSTEVEMRKLGWLLEADGHEYDVCPWCDLSVAKRDRRRRGDLEPVAPDPERLPNLVVIGAAKAGTTSLHNYLDLHPEIVMSQDKEMRFFTDPDCASWLGRYQEYFKPGARYRGESTPQYTKWPLFPGVPDRLADLAPDARLLYLVRDPIDRLVAEYVEEATWGVMTGGIEEHLVDLEAPHNPLVAPSRYATQLREFRRRFGADRILVVDLDELAARPADVLADVFGFLDLAPIDVDAEALSPRNAWGSKGALPGWYQALRRPALVRLVHKLPTERLSALRAFVRGKVSKPVDRPEPTARTLERLRAHLAPEVAELRSTTGLALAGWSL
ncbi:MAG TPA: sulfotransferase [Marmoricola sp.]|nr:sulfotransferase [Marmoricola sp.]